MGYTIIYYMCYDLKERGQTYAQHAQCYSISTGSTRFDATDSICDIMFLNGCQCKISIFYFGYCYSMLLTCSYHSMVCMECQQNVCLCYLGQLSLLEDQYCYFLVQFHRFEISLERISSLQNLFFCLRQALVTSFFSRVY